MLVLSVIMCGLIIVVTGCSIEAPRFDFHAQISPGAHPACYRMGKVNIFLVLN
jgi:hypothetical protein